MTKPKTEADGPTFNEQLETLGMVKRPAAKYHGFIISKDGVDLATGHVLELWKWLRANGWIGGAS